MASVNYNRMPDMMNKNVFLSDTALILIDIQVGVDPPSNPVRCRSTPALPQNITTLLAAFRERRAHIIHVQHLSMDKSSPLYASKPAIAFQTFANPVESEPVFIKQYNSAFARTGLDAYLKELGVRRLVFAGTSTDHCVSSTVRNAPDLGIVDDTGGGIGTNSFGNSGKGEVLLVGGATATDARGCFDAETVHWIHLASLDGEFCWVVKTKGVLAETKGWTQS